MSTWVRHRWSGLLVGLLVVGVIGLSAIAGIAGDTDRKTSAGRHALAESGVEQVEFRIREGATLEAELGKFEEDGTRIRFVLNDRKMSFVAVENLALDRVSHALEESTSPRTWSVSGVVTEYRGDNYLLITRAVLKARGNRVTRTTRRE